MNRWKIAQIIALVATIISVVGIILLIAKIHSGETLICIGMVIGLVSFIFGGFLEVLRRTWNIATIGWNAFSFPMSFIAFLFTAVFAFFAIACLPIIPVRSAYKKYGY